MKAWRASAKAIMDRFRQRSLQSADRSNKPLPRIQSNLDHSDCCDFVHEAMNVR